MVHIEDADKTGPFTCAGCGEPIIAKQGAIRTAHFAHKASSICSDPEGVLHKAAKQMIIQGFYRALKAGKLYYVEWHCRTCGRKHRSNLTDRGRAVVEEKSIGPTRPDLLVLDEKGQPVTAVEVVVTHPPTNETIVFYLSRWKRPTLIVKPKFTKLGELRNGIAVDRILSHGSLCPIRLSEATVRKDPSSVQEGPSLP